MTRLRQAAHAVVRFRRTGCICNNPAAQQRAIRARYPELGLVTVFLEVGRRARAA